jgi:hypothetical protein
VSVHGYLWEERDTTLIANTTYAVGDDVHDLLEQRRLFQQALHQFVADRLLRGIRATLHLDHVRLKVLGQWHVLFEQRVDNVQTLVRNLPLLARVFVAAVVEAKNRS